MRGMARLFLWAVLLAGLVTTTAGATVGDPPTFSFHRCDPDLSPCGDPVVIGQRKTFIGPVQVVGMHSSRGLCLFLDHVEQRSSIASCRDPALPRHGAAIDYELMGVERTFSGRKRVFSSVIGAVTPDVASVEFRYRRNGNEKQAHALVAQVSGELQAQLEEPEPFGVWAVILRGCASPRSYEAEAFDSGGSSLGTAKLRHPGGLCGGFDKSSAPRRSVVVN